MSVPFLPGTTFKDPSKQNHPKGKGGVKYHHGQPFVTSGAGSGQGLTADEEQELAQSMSALTYGSRANHASMKQKTPDLSAVKDKIPAHLAFDKKVLLFMAYMKQTVPESPLEHYRVRYFKIYYYLEDDTISVSEPATPNSGLPQGQMIKRQRLPKDNFGNCWSWKDLNIGINVTFYAKVFHIYDCNKFTSDFMQREGIELNDPEEPPKDPHSAVRAPVDAPEHKHATKSDYDRLKQFVALDRKVLRFYAVWDDRDNMFGEIRNFIIHYYLVDDTVEVREVHQNNDGRDPSPILMSRQKVPLNHKRIRPDFPSIVMEKKDEDMLDDFVGPADFQVAENINLLGRNFLITDCDKFTKEFYARNFGVEEFPIVDIPSSTRGQEVPLATLDSPYTGFGTHEDSLQSCISIVPKVPKKDYMKLLQHENTVLRFTAHFIADNSLDAQRMFIVSFRLSNDTISIFERAVPNSGMPGGKFLEATKVQLPDCNPNKPDYYAEKHLYIGAEIKVFGRTFVLDDCDDFVLRFMEEHPSMFPAENVEITRKHLESKQASS